MPCIDCNSDELIQDDREAMLICTNCGSVQEDHIINEEDEGTNYDNGMGVRKNNTRHGYVDGYNPYESFGTYIPKGSYITITRPDGSTYRVDLSKLNMIVSQSSKERSFNTTVSIFDKLNHNQKIHSEVINQAKRVWAEITKINQSIYRGSNRKGILASCILYSSYSTERPLNRTILCEIMDISKKDLSNGEPIFITLVQNTKYKSILDYSYKNRSEKTFSKYISDLGLDYAHVKECIVMYNSINIDNLKEKSIISGIIFIICKQNNYKISKKTIATVTQVTIPTLNKAYLSISEFLKQE